jgi:class 3 adenylate cyclase
MEEITGFEIVRLLGAGGMGKVYLAVDRARSLQVALKVLHPHVAAIPDISARFEREAESIRKLSHESIIKLHKFGREGSTFYLALEYIDGSPLSEILAQESPAMQRTVQLLMTVCDALSHAHGAGIVHRDVKPSNVFVRKDGKVFLGDFGIAKDLDPDAPALTQPGFIIGTPAYMSPEQVRAELVSPASDLYSLGIMAFEMVTGRVPFTADTSAELLTKHLNESPPSIAILAPGAPKKLADLIMRMLEKDPAMRPKNGREVIDSLKIIEEILPFPDWTRMYGRVVPESTTVRGARAYTAASGSPGPEESFFEEADMTLASFELAGFSRETCRKLLPARVAFLLESWYRFVRQTLQVHSGVVDRSVADRVTTIFGSVRDQTGQVRRALRAATSLDEALTEFNKAHGLHLRMRAGIVHGPVLIGRIAGDVSSTSVQGPLLAEMKALSKTKAVDAPIRLNEAAYKQVKDSGAFRHFVDPLAGNAWAAEARDILG